MRHVKMVLYGEPGVGKSVFASKAPRPFFITTDGNYEFLEDFGAKPEDHIQVNSWAEAKKAFAQKYDDYETVVIDLTEDLFKWCEYEYCRVNGYEHVSDVGFGKGYDITRNDFFIQICKILNLEKNVILIMHGITLTIKDRRGIEHTKHYPTNRIPDKVLDMIEGRVRYFLRAYIKAEEVDGKLVKKRYLSLVPKESEYGILRGVDENTVPSDIPLDFETFADTIGLTYDKHTENDSQTVVETQIEAIVPEKIESIQATEETIEEPVTENTEPISSPDTATVNISSENHEKTKEEKLAEIKARLAAMQSK